MEDTERLQTSAKPMPGLTSLAGHMLVATPQLDNTPFERSVILVCAHNEEGALGVIVNQPLDGLNLEDMLEQLDIERGPGFVDQEVFCGGPVSENRGFVVHSGDHISDDSIQVPGGFGLSSSLDTLKAIAHEEGPSRYVIALGYAGWGAGQLEDELAQDSWHLVPADEGLVFTMDRANLWHAAMSKLGVKDTGHLSHFVGRA